MNRIRQIVPVVLSLVLLGLAAWAIRQELKHVSLMDIERSLAAIPPLNKLAAIALTSFGYFTITGYDLLAFRYIHCPLAVPKIMLTSFISYAVGNTIGFTLFSGTAIRYRFYTFWRVSRVQIAKIIVFTHLSFWIGMLTIGGVVFLVDPLTVPDLLNLPFASLHGLGILFLALALLYLLLSWCYRKPFRLHKESVALPSINLSLGLIAVSAIDWSIAAAVLYILLPSHSGLSFVGFFGIYVLALTAGIISTVPGGLGVFETVMLWFRPSSVSASDMLGVLLAYRGIYYFLPLIVAVGLWLIHEWQRRRVS